MSPERGVFQTVPRQISYCREENKSYIFLSAGQSHVIICVDLENGYLAIVFYFLKVKPYIGFSVECLCIESFTVYGCSSEDQCTVCAEPDSPALLCTAQSGETSGDIKGDTISMSRHS